ncbi:MAG: CRTAC1 family protein [Acidobacteria bacterium]|nr:CRTAC1 family protein [Acidobacteriota bacterium]
MHATSRFRLYPFRSFLLIGFVFAATLAVIRHASSQEKSPPQFTPRFVDVSAQAGVTLKNLSGSPKKDFLLEVAGNGAAWIDFDNDGLLDLLIVNGSRIENIDRGGDPMLALYHNLGNGKFADVTATAGLTRKGWGMGVCVADIDNDGFDDFFVTAYGKVALYRNNGNGTFSDITEKSGIRESGWSTGCAFGDYDRDGFVDLYVANYVAMDVKKTPTPGVSSFCQYMGMNVLCGPRGLPGGVDHLYHNSGNGTFTDVSEKAGIRDPGYYGFGVLFTDFDNDGWPDIYVANDSTPNFLFHNNHDGTFTEIGMQAGVALSEEGRPQAGMGVDAGDYDGDGWLDIFVTNFSQDTSTLYRNHGDGTFSVETYRAGLGESSLPYLKWGTGLVDFDNDGWLDLFVANGHIYPQVDSYPVGSRFLEPSQLFQNLGNGRFREVSAKALAGLPDRSSRGVAFGDFDNDGAVDLAVVNLDDRPFLLRNVIGNKNHWLSLKLVGVKSNRDAIGAHVTLEVGGRKHIAEVRSGGSYISHNDFRVHFGLGSVERAARLEVRWPNGLVQKFENISSNQFLKLTEGGELTLNSMSPQK